LQDLAVTSWLDYAREGDISFYDSALVQVDTADADKAIEFVLKAIAMRVAYNTQNEVPVWMYQDGIHSVQEDPASDPNPNTLYIINN
jgi:hypothetical protein